MTDPHLQPAQEPTPHEKFMKGLRVLFSTTKAESDRQLAEAAERRKEQRTAKSDAKEAPKE
jgi:hypothetical protein